MLYIPLPFLVENGEQLLLIYLYFRQKREVHIKIINCDKKGSKKIIIYRVENLEKTGNKVTILESKFDYDYENRTDFYFCYRYLGKRVFLSIVGVLGEEENELFSFDFMEETINQIETNFTKRNDYSSLLSTHFYENFLLKKLTQKNNVGLKQYLTIRERIVYINLNSLFYKCYHSNYGKNFSYLLKPDEKEEIKKNNFGLPRKFCTMVMCVKNRADRAKLSIMSAMEHKEYFDFIVVEDRSDNMVRWEEMDEICRETVEYHVLDLGVPWSRSGLLNYGIRRAKTPYVLMWDVDFLYPSFFGEELYKLMNSVDPKKYLIQISLFETDFNFKTSQFYKACDPYSSVWIYPKEHLEEIYGFNEMFIGHGFEERELQMRLANSYSTKLIKSHQLSDKCYAFHLSHTDGTRFEDDSYYKLRNHNFLVMNECDKNKGKKAEHQKNVWGKGEFPFKYYEKVVKPRYLENKTEEN